VPPLREELARKKIIWIIGLSSPSNQVFLLK